MAKFAERTLGRTRAELARVEVLKPGIPQEQMPSLYAAATSFVLPSRGEGWGRPHAEAMSMGLPCIATNWSGNTEFMTKDNSLLIDIDGLVEIEEGAFRGHLWAQPSVAHLRQRMRFVHAHHSEAKLLGLRARDDMVASYSPATLADSVYERLRTLLSGSKTEL